MSQSDTPQTVWIACRAIPKGKCDGKQAVILRKVKTPGGGSITHYKCTKCGRRFGVQI